MYRLILFISIYLWTLPGVSQPTFNGYDVTNYELAQSDNFTHHKQDIYVSRENTGIFDAILIYTRSKRFVFADQNAEDSTFQSSYSELVNRYGKEDQNQDSIPPFYDDEDLDLLHRLILNKRARIHRTWNTPAENLRQIMLIWDHGGLTLVFDGK